mgnify:FL=1
MGQKTTMPSPKTPTLFESLLNFQKECPNLTRNKQAFNYKYTPLEVMLSVVQPILHQNGFLLTQSMGVSENEQPVVITRLLHQSGEELKSVTLLHLTDDAKGSKGMHSWGGSITYARRYSIKLILGIEPDMDTNAEDADLLSEYQRKLESQKVDKPEISRTPTKPAPTGHEITPVPQTTGMPKFITPALRSQVETELRGLTDARRKKVLADFKTEFKISAQEITPAHITLQAHGEYLAKMVKETLAA